jgi:uncharacterized protein YigE (DUF2233 family)
MGFLTKALSTKNGKIFLVCLFFSTLAFADQGWKTLSDGIAYRDLRRHSPWSHVHVFKIQLKKNQFQSVMATALQKKLGSVQEFAQFLQAPLAINGGFFDSEFHPLGLRISHYTQKNPIKFISWWGIFYIKNNKAYITTPDRFKPSPKIAFAIQSGPRLLVHGKPTSLKPGLAERTALGITPDGQVIILVTENASMTTLALAKLLQSLSCTHALNLDGGSSTQLYAKLPHFRLRIYGYSHVSDAVVISPRR